MHHATVPPPSPMNEITEPLKGKTVETPESQRLSPLVNQLAERPVPLRCDTPVAILPRPQRGSVAHADGCWLLAFGAAGARHRRALEPSGVRRRVERGNAGNATKDGEAKGTGTGFCGNGASPRPAQALTLALIPFN